MPFPNWLSGGFQAVNRVYGAVDKNLAGGLLPGGADSPYMGRSVNRKKVEEVQDFARELTAVNAARSLLHQVNPLANKALNSLRSNPATQVPISTIEKVQEFLNPKLRKPVTFTGFINQPDAFHGSENRINVQGVISDQNRARFSKDLDKFNEKISTIMQDLQSLPWGSNPELNERFNKLLDDERFNKLLDEKPQLRNYATYSAPVALHEFGHALNLADPFSVVTNRMRNYGKQIIQPGTIGGLSAGRSSQDENRNLFQAGIEGLLGNISAPGVRHTLEEEGLASRRAIRMAGELGLPKGRRMLGSAFATYAGPPAAQGFTEGVIGELASRGAEKLADVVTDYVIDPVVDRLRGSDYSGLEQSLRQYGYDESKHRLKGTGYGSPFQVEFK